MWATTYAEEQLAGSDDELRFFALPEDEEEMTENYITQAMRTNSTVVGVSPAVSPDLLHATLGINSELHEYDMAKSWLNAIEELGDLCWFVALAAFDLGCDPFQKWDTYLDEHPDSMLLKEAVAEFLDLVKGAYAYNKPLDIPRLHLLLDVMAGRIAKIIRSKSKFTPDEVLAANIEKLRARFPEKFDTELALHRNVKQEAGAMRAVLH